MSGIGLPAKMTKDEAYIQGMADGESIQLKTIFDGLAKSGLTPADYMAIIRLINKILGLDREPTEKLSRAPRTLS